MEKKIIFGIILMLVLAAGWFWGFTIGSDTTRNDMRYLADQAYSHGYEDGMIQGNYIGTIKERNLLQYNDSVYPVVL